MAKTNKNSAINPSKGNDLIPIASLKQNPGNPRFIKDEKFKNLVQSLVDFPEMLHKRPLICIIDPDDQVPMPLGGNMRLKAIPEAIKILNKIGTPDAQRRLEYLIHGVPVMFADEWTEDQQKEFIIKDNLPYGEWDWDVLGNEWSEEQLIDWGMVIPDYSSKDQADATDDGFIIPDKITTTIKTGDIFDIGSHRLICGDSRKAETYTALLGHELASLLITDPPYGVDYVGKTKEALKIKNDAMSESDTHRLWKESINAFWPFIKNGGTIYATVPPGPLHIGFASALHDLQALRQIIVWNKNSMVMGRSDYHYKHEPILYGWKPGASHNWYSDRKQTSVVDFDRPMRSSEHPTMKPIPLFGYFVKNSSKEGDIVVDLFSGSGTTMVACEQLKRRAYVIELDPKYCQVIIDRMIALDPNIIVLQNSKPYVITKEIELTNA